MTYRVRNIAIAVALAVVAALLTTFYVTNYKKSVQRGEKAVTVYVAARNIPIGTSGSDVVDRGWIRSEKIDRNNVVPGAISSPDQIEELSATQPLFEGDQVSTSRFRPLAEQGIHGQLKGNVRALQVPGDEHQLLLGTLKDGDRVDVVGTWEFPESSQVHVSRVVLRDVPVLRAASEGRVQSKIASGGNLPFNAILAVTDRQAHKLFWLMKNGEWSLQLRGVADAADSPESADSSASLFVDGMNQAQLRKSMGQIRRSSRR
jgi:Flp pilus assembly protein CpaB